MSDILYKFISSPSAVENIAAGNLKFATIPDLNDPNEMLAEMNDDAVAFSLRELRDTGVTDYQYKWLCHQSATLNRLAPHMHAVPMPVNKEAATRQLKNAFYDNAVNMERLHRRTVKIMQDRVGILSLTTNNQSLPMWAHYANNAAGFVVEFSELESVFRGDDTGSLNALKPVDYYSDFKGMTFDPSTQDRLFFSKHESWSYEQEWRVVVPLGDCSQPSQGLHLMKICKTHISGIILGWRCSAADRASVRKAIANLNPRVTVKQASVVRGQLTIIDISRTQGD